MKDAVRFLVRAEDGRTVTTDEACIAAALWQEYGTGEIYVRVPISPTSREKLKNILEKAADMVFGVKNIDPAVAKAVETALTTRANLIGQMAAAFIAHTGCPPDEVELVERVIHDEVSYSFRRKPREV